MDTGALLKALLKRRGNGIDLKSMMMMKESDEEDADSREREDGLAPDMLKEKSSEGEYGDDDGGDSGFMSEKEDEKEEGGEEAMPAKGRLKMKVDEEDDDNDDDEFDREAFEASIVDSPKAMALRGGKKPSGIAERMMLSLMEKKK